MYKNYAKVAREEGFEDIAQHFERVATVEKFHNERYEKVLKTMNDGETFKRDKKVIWECGNCGYHIIGEKHQKLVLYVNIQKHTFSIKKKFFNDLILQACNLSRQSQFCHQNRYQFHQNKNQASREIRLLHFCQPNIWNFLP